jgi:hypothetical protein
VQIEDNTRAIAREQLCRHVFFGNERKIINGKYVHPAVREVTRTINSVVDDRMGAG